MAGLRKNLAGLSFVNGFTILLAICLLQAEAGAAGAGIMSRISTDANGVQGNGNSSGHGISDDGRYVLFQSDANNLVLGDANLSSDVFVKDTATGAVSLISVGTGGSAANGNSYAGAISADGRFVTFMSDANDLVSGDTNSVRDVFMRDLQLNTTTRVSVSTAGTQANGMSGFYESDISADGRFIVFESDADNLVSGDTNTGWDIFLRDNQTNTTTRVSTKADGSQATNGFLAPSISADGLHVSFGATDGDLVAGDNNGVEDVFLKDTGTGAVSRVSTDSAGAQADDYSAGSRVAPGGRYVAFESGATNLLGVGGDTNGVRDIYLKDTQTGATTRLSTDSAGAQANGPSYFASFSDDARHVAFSSSADNLVSGDGNTAFDMFVKDTTTGQTLRVSVDTYGAEGNGASNFGSIAADGRFVVMSSAANNLVFGDTNGVQDAFITPVGRHYFLTWYDNLYAADWVLAANPDGAAASRWINLTIDDVMRDIGAIPGYAVGEIPSPGIMTPQYPGLIGGPVDLGSLTGEPMLVSRRTLWGVNSFEEVVATGQEQLSDRYFWTWYDQQTPGFQNWVMIANPNADRVYYEVTVAGTPMGGDYIDPGDKVTPAYPGVMGGPVELRAWTDNTKTTPARVIASQRVLSNFGQSFNEVMGTPVAEITNQYIWTWYDNQSPGAQNWVIVANHNSAGSIYFEVKIAGNVIDDGTLLAGQVIPIVSQGTMGGPVEVQAWTSPARTVNAVVMASQRVIWGPSFTETPGFPTAALDSSYHWTWYDQQTPGSSNWVLIFNPNGTQIYYEIYIGGVMAKSGTVDAGLSDTPQIPGSIGGPVEVRAWLDISKGSPRNVFASQRVLWNGHFNEVPGTVLE